MKDGFVKDLMIQCFKLSAVLPDKLYLKLVYRIRTGKKLNIENPQTFNEKIQWMKVNDRNPFYTVIADKYAVRDYVKEKVGEEYLTRLYGVYDSVEEIPFEKLPEQFVLKATHDSGGCIICHDKNELDVKQAKKKLGKLLKRNFWWKGREWCYKDITPRIICEELLQDNVLNDLLDYKFFCFNGEPQMLFVATDRGKGTKFDFFDLDFKHLDIKNHYPNTTKEIAKPQNFEKMIELARVLATDFKQVRVDFYNIGGKIYFGELTLYHFSGMENFEPVEWEYKLGEAWKVE